jgi:hypothetical protein
MEGRKESKKEGRKVRRKKRKKEGQGKTEDPQTNAADDIEQPLVDFLGKREDKGRKVRKHYGYSERGCVRLCHERVGI